MKRPLFVLLCSCLLAVVWSVVPAAAADNPISGTVSQYSLGDQTLSINVGLFVPLFLLPTGTVLLASSPPHLSLGGDGYLSWAAYVTPHIRLGLDVAGTFTFDPNNNALLMLPFLAKISYSFMAYPFEIPVSLGVGMNVIKYTDLSTIDLLVKPGVALYWIYDSSWSFGLNVGYWFDMQFDTESGELAHWQLPRYLPRCALPLLKERP